MARCRAGGHASHAPSPQCCPNYGVRTDVTRFKPSKNHKKALRRFSRFLAGVRDVPSAAAGKDGRTRNTAGKDGGNNLWMATATAMNNSNFTRGNFGFERFFMCVSWSSMMVARTATTICGW